jgi:predicted TIM-barrel fold metal-dependent hydrolase
MSPVIDVDQHLFELPETWRDYCDPSNRHKALSIEPDELGHWWITSGFLGRRIATVVVTVPEDGFAATHGEAIRRLRGEPATVDYRRDVPPDYWNPTARVAKLDEFGVDRAILLPNWGLVWPHGVADRLDVLRANMEAWNRWAVEVRQEGKGRLEPTGHVTLRGGDMSWVVEQLSYLGSHGVRLAYLSYGLVDGRRMSHPDHDRAWAAFVEHGITPVFHIQDGDVRPSGLSTSWFDNDDPLYSVLEFPFSQLGVQIAIADLVLNGVFERFPGLKICCIELTGGWLTALTQGSARQPQSLGFGINGPGLDIAYMLGDRLTGRYLRELPRLPSEYVFERVLAAVNVAEPVQAYVDAGLEDNLMFGGDYPHSEGLLSPYESFSERVGPLDPGVAAKFYGGNATTILGLS